MLLATIPSAASATLLTFDEFEPGTLITNEYADSGVLFSGSYGQIPEIAFDGSNPTSPVLRGGETFYEPLHAQFVYPGTTTPTTVSELSLDIGYIDDPGSTELVLQTTTGPIILTADEYGINSLSSTASNITGFDVEAVEEESAGVAIDNLSFTAATPPPQPSRAERCYDYAIYDTRGSGEEKAEVSNPGRDFVRGFRARLAALGVPHRFAAIANLYPAVGVWSWSPLRPGKRLNGFGAFLHSDTIGAYWDSEREGERKLRSMIKRQVRSFCGKRKTKIVLLGYSQGAQATGNVYTHLSRKQRKHVAAVVLWGDPLYNHRDRIADRERRKLNGSLGVRKKFPAGRKVFSFCNKHDPICQWRLPPHQLAWYRLKEHSLYWKSRQAENHGRAVATFLARRR